MKLHGEAVLDAHAGHFGEHLGAEDLLLLGDGATGEDAAVEGGCCGGVEVGGLGGEMAVIGGGAAHGLEEGAAVAEGVEIAVVAGDVFAGDLAELVDVAEEAGVLGVDDGVGTEGGDDAALPSGFADGFVVFEGVEGGVGGGEDFDVEFFEERAGTEVGGLERFCDDRRSIRRRFLVEPFGEAELIFEGVVEPEAGGGAAEEVVIFCEDAPDLAGIGLFGAIELRNAEGFERDALGVEHAEDVVVGLDQEGGWIGEGLVEGKPAGSVCPCGEMMGQIFDCLVQSCGDGCALLPQQEIICSHPEIFIYTLRLLRVRKRQHRKPIKDFAAPRTNGKFW